MIKKALEDCVRALQGIASQNGGKLSSKGVGISPSPWEAYWNGLCALVWEYDATIHPDPPVDIEGNPMPIIPEDGCTDCQYCYSYGRQAPDTYYCKLTSRDFMKPEDGWVDSGCPGRKK